MGVRRDSVGSYCLKMSRQLGNVPSVRLVLCLLLVVGLCSCDQFEPQKEQKPAEAPVKMPLPQRLQPPANNTPAAQTDKKETVPAAGAASKPAQVATATTPAAKPAPKKADAAPANGSVKIALPAHTDNKGQKPPVAAKNEVKNPQQAKKAQLAPAEKKGAPVAEKPKTTVAVKKQEEKEKTLVPPVKKKEHPAATGVSSRKWTVVAGPYLLEETLATDMAKIAKTGLSATVHSGGHRKSAMHRLFLGQFDDRAAAQEELGKLKKVTSDAFILDRGGKHTVYAGSYLLASRAESEKERLAAAGFALAIKRADVAIPSKRLIVGTYRDKAAAEAAAKKLKNAGLKDVRVRQ